MPEHREGWIDVQELNQRVSIQDIAAHFRFDLGENFGTTGEQRTRCPVVTCKGHDSDRSVSINVSEPRGLWKCHEGGYGCGANGDKLAFAFALKNGSLPPGRLAGKDFLEAGNILKAIANGDAPEADQTPAAPSRQLKQAPTQPTTIDDTPNSPLLEADKENIRALATLDEQFTLDPSEMTPNARRYFQSREWLTPELCTGARCGYLPKSARGTLRGMWVFAVCDEAGQVLSWIGRNVNFQEEYDAWLSAGRRGKEPTKYKFPSKHYFRRKFELYGQEAMGLPEHQAALSKYGLTVTEGFNDVLRLRQLGLPSVGIMSNHITSEQVRKAVRLVEEDVREKINVLFDTDSRGEEGALQTVAKLAQTGIAVQLAWSRSMSGGACIDREAESISASEIDELKARLAR